MTRCPKHPGQTGCVSASSAQIRTHLVRRRTRHGASPPPDAPPDLPRHQQGRSSDALPASKINNQGADLHQYQCVTASPQRGVRTRAYTPAREITCPDCGWPTNSNAHAINCEGGRP